MNINRNVLTPALYPAIAAVLLLLIPLIVMQFTDEVVWTLSDFMVAGALIFGTGLAYRLISRKATAFSFKFAAGLALLAGLLLIWVNLAVGIIGSEDNPANLWYFGVIAVGLVGAFLSRFRPDKLALPIFAMTIAQALLTAVALVGGFYQTPPTTVVHILGINTFFITLFVISALLFRYAGSKEKKSQS